MLQPPLSPHPVNLSPVPGLGGDGGDVAVDNSGPQAVYYGFGDLNPISTVIAGFDASTGQPTGDANDLELAAPASRTVRYSGLNSVDHVYLGGIPDSPISGASDSSPVIISTNSSNLSLLRDGDKVVVKDAAGNVLGTWPASSVTATGFTLEGSTSGDSTNMQGGTWSVGGNAGGSDYSFAIVVDAFSETTPAPILIGGGALTGIYESLDRGETVTDVTPSDMNGNATFITYAAPYDAYFGTTTGQLFFRTFGSGFQQIPVPSAWLSPDGTNNGTIARQIITDPNNSGVVYVFDSQGQIWCSTEAGQNGWTDLTKNSGLVSLTHIALFNPVPGTPGGGVLLAAALGGVYRATCSRASRLPGACMARGSPMPRFGICNTFRSTHPTAMAMCCWSAPSAAAPGSFPTPVRVFRRCRSL